LKNTIYNERQSMIRFCFKANFKSHQREEWINQILTHKISRRWFLKQNIVSIYCNQPNFLKYKFWSKILTFIACINIFKCMNLLWFFAMLHLHLFIFLIVKILFLSIATKWNNSKTAAWIILKFTTISAMNKKKCAKSKSKSNSNNLFKTWKPC